MEPADNFELLNRYLSGGCSEAEQEAVQRWLAESDVNRATLDILRNSRQALQQGEAEIDTEAAWQTLTSRAGITEPGPNVLPINGSPAKKSGRTFRWHTLLRYAAVFLLAAALPWFYFTYMQSGGGVKQVTVEYGKRMTLTLADGTTVKLDAGSTLRYPERFSGESREVYLHGEGFFTVARAQAKPFIIHAGAAKVEVLGTRFNVRAWNEDGAVTVAVAGGKVSLSSEQSGNNGIILTAGLLGIVETDGTLNGPVKTDIGMFTGWEHNDLVFDNAPLKEVLAQLTRWYGLEFKIDSARLAERLTIHLQNQPVDAIFDLLSVLTDLKYEKHGNRIVFSE